MERDGHVRWFGSVRNLDVQAESCTRENLLNHSEFPIAFKEETKPGLHTLQSHQTRNPHEHKNHQTSLVNFEHESRRMTLTREALPFFGSPTVERRPPDELEWQKHGNADFMTSLSAMYGIFLVVLGLCFPMSSVISSKIHSSFFDIFYMYMYIVAILFLLYVYCTVKGVHISFGKIGNVFRPRKTKPVPICTPEVSECEKNEQLTVYVFPNEKSDRLEASPSHHHGSFYLRIGAVVFGIGSMIYSCLDFGQYFELKSDYKCRNLMLALTPISEAIFTFIQMYFVFLNSKVFRKRHPWIASFGLLHLVATNLCVWLNVIIQETKHEILFFSTDSLVQTTSRNENNYLTTKNNTARDTSLDDLRDSEAMLHHRRKRGSLIDECHRTDIMGTIVQDASPFLFPCAIEYSLLCAAIMFEMWKSGHQKSGRVERFRHVSNESIRSRRLSHQYSVDCARSNKGLFTGIFLLVLCIITLILFFVLINNPEYKPLAVTAIYLAELVLYFILLIAVAVAIYQVRELRYLGDRSLGLDNTLLLIALCGLLAYNSFTIVACFFGGDGSIIILISALCAVVQASTQTLFLLDASKRAADAEEQQFRKPGREIVTFLLVANFTLWAMITLEKSRSDAHPVQLAFFGLWPWTIITNIFRPLAIFFRFHSTVCLFEIWKRSYKLRATNG